ncbi:MAG: nucleoside-diphosphate kinase [Tissierellia bacterium]|jgi:nucleoside-diphosphate kinase|nr:nucleoside-diphosphate kinase [Tissierellia bacterium]
MEKTFVMVKPDGVERKLVGEIIGRIEKKGFNILDIKMINPTKEIVEEHYDEHKEKPFFEELVNFILQGPVVGIIVEGENVIEVIRLMIGDKNPKFALPGTIRGDFANTTTMNLVHASDSVESSDRELNIWFN